MVRGHPGGVQHRDLDLGQRPSHGGVRQLHHDPHVRAELAGQQRGLQRVQVVFLRADDRRRVGQPGRHERLCGAGAAGDVGHAPGDEIARQAQVGVVVHGHGRDAGQAQLLHDAEPDPVQAAHDHVPAPVGIRRVSLSGSFPWDSPIAAHAGQYGTPT